MLNYEKCHPERSEGPACASAQCARSSPVTITPVPAHFSTRTSWNLAETPYATAVRRARTSGRRLYDLTQSNPTTCGLAYNAESLLAPLANPASLTYDPDPRGLASARTAVANYYAARNAPIDPGHIQLTTSTSEAYSFLFRLLCNAGDSVLIPQPSYPLFDFLAQLDDVTLTPYPLFYDHGWHIDLSALERSITSTTRAIIIVHPNNPTGHFTSASERTELERIAEKNNLALIVDEVFLDFSLTEQEPASFATGNHPALTFVLSGLSKIAGLPQMKSAWLTIQGPEALRDEALARIEVIADTFLSLNAPIQHAIPNFLSTLHAIQSQIHARTTKNILALDRLIAATPNLSRLDTAAGWSVILRTPEHGSSVDQAIQLAEKHALVMHPGSFYGLPDAGRLVASLLTPEADFEQGITLLASTL